MPVYNEEEAIEGVIAEWVEAIDPIVGNYEIRVYDDGSRDGTAAKLQNLAARYPKVVAASHANRGHGPTIMRGYLESNAEWIFQVDSDGEMPATAFPSLWKRRAEYDVVIGSRDGRSSPLHRRILTKGSRFVIALLFGRRVRDVNAPYRLMRGSWLREQLQRMPADAAVPNILLSGLAGRGKARVLEVPVPHTGRRTGSTTLNLKRIARLSLRAVLDAIRVATGHSGR
jgi:glycosyltransferase involved in cell wall biosynthesis